VEAEITMGMSQEEFLEKLWKKNQHYREGFFELLHYYNSKKVMVKTIYGECQLSSTPLLSGCKPSIKSALNKTDYVNNQLKHNNIGFAKGDIVLKQEITKVRGKVLIEDKYGELSVSLDSLLRGAVPNIESAVDIKTYFKNRLKDKNKKIYLEIIDLEKPVTLTEKITVLTKYGELLISPRDLEKLKTIDFRSAKNPKEFLMNKIITHRKNYTETDFSKIDIGKAKDNLLFICKKHNFEYLQRLDHYLNNHQGCSRCSDNILFYNEKSVLEKENIKCTFYIINLQKENENFYKIGITTKTVEKRIKEIERVYKVLVIHTELSNLKESYLLEQDLLKEFSQYKVEPLHYFGGHTECLSINPLDAYGYWNEERNEIYKN